YDELGVIFVVPENTRISHRVLIPTDKLNGAKAGQVVLVKLIAQPSRIAQPVGHVSQVLGEHAAPGMETEIAIYSHGLPHEFPDAVLAAAEKFGDSVQPGGKRDREDLRELPLVTIDGEDARDFDDAVWCERTGSGARIGWRLIVAIADVGHYVAPDSALDVEAQTRGTSVYFPNRVLPMLPEALSNGLCSLKPQVERLCVACEMMVSAQGKITRARFFEGLMRSAARLTYTEVAAYLVQSEVRPEAQAPDSKAAQVGAQLRALHDVYLALHRARIERGAIDFDAPELKVRFGVNGKIATFVEQPRNDAHRLIEECMIAANVEAARFLKKHRIPTLYRVHATPEQDRLEQLQEFLRGFAISLPRDRDPTPQDFSDILRRVADNEEARLIETVVIRSMPQAVYQPNNVGHFGLALPHYVHFTSPIRRYPDLIVHRGIRHVLRGGTAEDLPNELRALEGMGQQCSLKERRADEATRDAMAWLKCEFMSDKIGEEFDTIVTGVVDFGLFVQVKGMQIDGLIHVTGLGADYFSRDASKYRLVGQRSKRVFKLGDHLRVRLINVVIDERKIDFELAESAARRSDAGSHGRDTSRRPDNRRGGSQFGRRGRKS
ncbi:MAG: ribonuclease R, partial [Candidatus Obscuribacterales bacterium]|nr:ribonuclease R [Steroidobacteraceae bacterium]